MQVFSDEEQIEMWNAVLARESRWDGHFFFGVRSTGIYCRPSCPARRPKRESVEFFRSSDTAEKNGFRPCKRCHPNRIGFEKEEYYRCIDILGNPVNEITSVKKWADQSGMTVTKLRKVLHSYSGLSPRDLIMNNKINLFKRNIQAGELLSSSQYAAGFGSPSRLYEKAADNLGMTPGQYKKGGLRLRIFYETLDTPLGKMILAGTTRGVCSIKFGDNEIDLLKELDAEYPQAIKVKQTGELNGWVEQIKEYFEGINRQIDIPLDVQATAFQVKVWSELRKIPFGETRSYSQLAEAVGKPFASRAVATACAANPVAIVNPCHRIIHSDGTISGYRWGVERKKALLDLEKENSTGD